MATPDQQGFSEIYDVRAALESLAARSAAREATRAEVTLLRDNLRQQEKTDQNDIEGLLQLNSQFFTAIYRASRNRYLIAGASLVGDPRGLLKGTTHADPSAAGSVGTASGLGRCHRGERCPARRGDRQGPCPRPRADPLNEIDQRGRGHRGLNRRSHQGRGTTSNSSSRFVATRLEACHRLLPGRPRQLIRAHIDRSGWSTGDAPTTSELGCIARVTF